MPRSRNTYIAVGIALLIVGISAYIAFPSRTQSASNLLSGSEFSSALTAAPAAVLIDVRTPAEYSAGHIKGAINIDAQDPAFETNIASLDPSGTYFIYCQSGRRSGIASAKMAAAGLTNVFELQGGVGGNPQIPLSSGQ